MTPKEVLAQIRQREVTTVDLRFMDFPGVWQHFSIPADALTEETFEEGIGFDGSSVVGWRAINEADLLVVPQPETALIDPFTAQPTLTMICNIQDPITQQDYTRDPRNIARKAVSYMRSTGLADTCLLAPGAGVLRLRRRPVRPARPRGVLPRRFGRGGLEPRPGRAARTSATSRARAWATSPARRPTAWPTSAPRWPSAWPSAGSPPSAHYHEVATGGQCEIDLDARSRWSRAPTR